MPRAKDHRLDVKPVRSKPSRAITSPLKRSETSPSRLPLQALALEGVDPSSGSKPRKQVAALPVCLDPEGRLRVLLVTSRDTHRLIIPKGWCEKGLKDRHAAAKEAEEEAGIMGRIGRKPIGTYQYWKRLPTRSDLVRVKVFLLQAEQQLKHWREEGQRETGWFLLDEAIERVDEAGVAAILRELATRKRVHARPLASLRGPIGASPAASAAAPAQPAP